MKYLIILLMFIGCTQQNSVPQTLFESCVEYDIDTVYQEKEVHIFIPKEKDLNELSFEITEWMLLLDTEMRDTIGGSLPSEDIYARQFALEILQDLQNKINLQ